MTGSAEFTALVELAVSCRGLPKMDVGSKSDPMAVLYQTSGAGFADRSWAELGRTEFQKNTHGALGRHHASLLC